jgi:acetylornithine deacetylase/succinyl-diaminopimelate desuccinylase-like protein
MRLAACVVVLCACHGSADVTADAAPSVDAAPDAPENIDHWKQIFDEVDAAHLQMLVTDMAHERYSATGRAQFRAYWTSYMMSLGLPVQSFDFQGNPRPGTNLEAVLAGPSQDSVVVIVHYDSIGPPGQETSNPGADDDMTGMAIELETARLLVEHKSQLTMTVRFVASDEEELGALAGARAYAQHIQQAGIHVVAAVDDEQSGWNCLTDGVCSGPLSFDLFSCGSSQTQTYDYNALGDQFAAIAQAYSPLRVARHCMDGAHSDHFAMWEIGVPAIVYGESDPFDNPHFDQWGGDTVDKIDFPYLVQIARPAITFQASLAGLAR